MAITRAMCSSSHTASASGELVSTATSYAAFSSSSSSTVRRICLRIAQDEDRAGQAGGHVLPGHVHGDGRQRRVGRVLGALADAPDDELAEVARRSAAQPVARLRVGEDVVELTRDRCRVLEPEQRRGRSVRASYAQRRIRDEDGIRGVLEGFGQHVEHADPVNQSADLARELLQRVTFVGGECALARILDVDDPADEALIVFREDRHAQLRAHFRRRHARRVIVIGQHVRNVLHVDRC